MNPLGFPFSNLAQSHAALSCKAIYFPHLQDQIVKNCNQASLTGWFFRVVLWPPPSPAKPKIPQRWAPVAMTNIHDDSEKASRFPFPPSTLIPLPAGDLEVQITRSSHGGHVARNFLHFVDEWVPFPTQPFSPLPSPFPSPFLSPRSPFSPFSPFSLLLPSPFLLPFSFPFLNVVCGEPQKIYDLTQNKDWTEHWTIVPLSSWPISFSFAFLLSPVLIT